MPKIGEIIHWRIENLNDEASTRKLDDALRLEMK